MLAPTRGQLAKAPGNGEASTYRLVPFEAKPWLQDLMVQPLMRAFPVIVDRVFGHRFAQRGLAEQDDS